MTPRSSTMSTCVRQGCRMSGRTSWAQNTVGYKPWECWHTIMEYNMLSQKYHYPFLSITPWVQYGTKWQVQSRVHTVLYKLASTKGRVQKVGCKIKNNPECLSPLYSRSRPVGSSTPIRCSSTQRRPCSLEPIGAKSSFHITV